MSDLSFPAEASSGPRSRRFDQSVITVTLILTLLAAGAGALAGMNLVDQTRMAVLKTEREHNQAGIFPVYESTGHIQPIKPVIANLAEPKNMFIRIQGTVVFSKDDVEDTAVLVSRIESDISAYVRTLTLADIEGAGGLRHLREDLNQRALIRTEGKINEFILETMVVQ